MCDICVDIKEKICPNCKTEHITNNCPYGLYCRKCGYPDTDLMEIIKEVNNGK